MPHPETETVVPTGRSELGGGKITGLADATLKSKGVANYMCVKYRIPVKNHRINFRFKLYVRIEELCRFRRWR